MKKLIFSIILYFIGINLIFASTTLEARIGNNYYDNLEDAINAASSTDTITLISNTVLDNTLKINKVVNINLNGNDILASEKVFEVKGGYLTLTGSGKIKETNPNYGAIMLIGRKEYTEEKYSGVSIDSDVILEGWSGIFINHELSKSYGVVVDLKGKINAVDDINGNKGIGVYINGNIKEQNSYPVVNIMDGAHITSTGVGLYIAGYSKFYIGDAYISGIESGIGIKSGILNIDGATVVCNGEDTTPTEGYNNGIKSSGTTIQIESNNGYAGDIEIDISNGTFVSKNSNVIYEYIGRGNSSLIYSMSISGGTFVSGNSKDVFSLTKSFKDIHSGFISGGKYSTNPSSYLKSGYTVVENKDSYEVVKSSLKEVSSNNVVYKRKNSLIKVLIFLILIILSYINRTKIINMFKKVKCKIL